MKTTHSLTPDEAARISRAIEAAETRTSGEIFVVVAAHADDYRLVPVLWATVAALVLVWPLNLFTLLPVGQLLLVQAAIFVLWCMVLTPDAVRLRVIPPPLAAANVERAAREQFLGHGVHLTAARTGVLIYVALAERRVEIVADDGIAKKVDQAEWDAIAQTIVTAARNKVLADGLMDAVKTAGALLARHFPPSKDDHDELPNRVVQL
jgi:putative membrane protein